MKKLALFFIVLISLVIIAGCNRQQGQPVETEKKTENSTVIKKVEDEKETSEDFVLEIPTEKVDKKEVSAFSISYPKQDYLKTTKNYHKITGTADEEVVKILVNNKPLNEFKKGDKEWSYIVSRSLNNLKNGRNSYIIEGLNKDNEVIYTLQQTIDYNGGSDGKLASVGNPLLLPMVISLVTGLAIRRKR